MGRWKNPPKSSLVCRDLRCRCAVHQWEDMKMAKGAVRRMCTGRRGCKLCGLVQIRQSNLVSSGSWLRWGYLHPDDLHKDLADISYLWECAD